MSKQLIEKYYDSFNQGRYEEMINLVSDDILHEVNEGDTQHGKSLFKAFLGVMDECYEEQVKNLVVFSSTQHNRFAAEFNIDGRYKKSQPGLPEAHGQKYFINVGAFFEINPLGKICRITNYYNLNNWINTVQPNTF